MADEYRGSDPAANSASGSARAAGPRPLRIDILTVLPAMFAGPFDHSMIRRARAAGLVDIRVHDLRDWTEDRHRTTDDEAYGGGGGMVMTCGPVFRAVEDLLGLAPRRPGAAEPLPAPVIMLTPQGRRFDHAAAAALAREDRLIVLAGHYEGFDERIRLHLASHELSVGDFVVTGGEIPAMLLVDAVARLRPGVVGHPDATASDSFASGGLEHPHYTRPADFRGWRVPDVLLSGHHGEVARWRRREALRRTWVRRPDLIPGMTLSDEERAWLQAWQAAAPQAEA